MSIVLTLNGAYILLSFIIWPYFYILANLSSYSNYIFGTMDPDKTGVVTFEVSKLDNFWWKVEIFKSFLNVKHDSFFQLTGKLASKWQRSRKPHSCHIRTKGSLGEVLLSGTGFQFVLSLDFIWFYYSVFILFFRTLRLALLFCNGEGEFMFNSKWNGLRSWTLQEKYGNGLVSIFTDHQKQKFQHGTVCAHECCRKIWKLNFSGLSRKLTRPTYKERLACCSDRKHVKTNSGKTNFLQHSVAWALVIQFIFAKWIMHMQYLFYS